MSYYNVIIEQEQENEKGGTKKVKSQVLVEAESTEEAGLIIHKEYEGTMGGFEISKVEKTRISAVFMYKK